LDHGLILYLHGFTSGPQSMKARALQARMEARGLGGHFICPQLPHAPRDAIALAEAIIAGKVGAGDTPVLRGAIHGNTPITLVGSSLGGYYATWLAEKHGLKAVLVNPVVVAHLMPEKFIGPQHNIYTGERFEFTQEHVAQLRAIEVPQLVHPENFWLLAEAGDEVLDYRQAVEKYRGARQTVLPGGDHGFTRWADYLDEILAVAALA
jgi:uncharacterized protein